MMTNEKSPADVLRDLQNDFSEKHNEGQLPIMFLQDYLTKKYYIKCIKTHD